MKLSFKVNVSSYDYKVKSTHTAIKHVLKKVPPQFRLFNTFYLSPFLPVSPLDISKPPVSVEKEARRALSPPAPVPPQPPKPQSLPCPVPPKPQVPPAATKPTPQPIPLQRSLSPPTPVPVPQKSPSKTATSPKSPQPQSTTVTSPPFSSRTAPEKPAQRGSTASALPQDEPPWMALAKKKAKAWSEMPQIVQ